MPTYIYKCKNEHYTNIVHGMLESFSIECRECNELMWRTPQIPYVNWGGLPPHLEHLRAPVVQHMIDTEQERREQYYIEKEKRT